MRISCLYQSGVLVEFSTMVLVFDYYKGTLPVFSKDKPLYVFVSHAHKDHYQECIFEWEKKFSQVYYILSCDIHLPASKNRLFVAPHQTYSIGNLKLRTLLSTDEGVAFLVTCEDKVIYHSGDLHWWHWEGEEESTNENMKTVFQNEIASLEKEKVDVAFLPLDPRLGDAFYWGFDWFMSHVEVKHAIPIHLWGKYSLCNKLLNQEETRDYRDKIWKVNQAGEEFIIE